MELKHESDPPVPEIRERVVAEPRHGAAVDRHVPAVGDVERAEQVQQRALPGPARAHDRDHLPALHRQVDAVEHVDDAAVPAPVRLRHIHRLEDRHSCLMASTG
jgi:hypothetical protein